MTNDEAGWTGNARTLTRFRVLRALAAADRVGSDIDGPEIAEALGLDPEDVAGVLDGLAEEGLVTRLPATLSPGYTTDATITPAGRSIVGDWDAASTGGARRRACMAAMLSWLDSDDGTAATGTDQLVESVQGHLYGVPFGADLTHEVARELKELELIAGTGTPGGPVVWPKLTALGRTVVDRFGGDVSAWQAGPPGGTTSVVVSDSTGVNIASHSPGAQQHAQVESGAQAVLNTLADALAQMLQDNAEALALDPSDLGTAYALVGQLREAAIVVDSDPEPARRRLATLRDIFKHGSGSALGAALIALGEHAASLI